MSRLYLEAASVLEKVLFQKMGVKNAVYASKCAPKQKPAILGIVSKVVANHKLLQGALEAIGAFKTEEKMRTGLLFVMTAELVLGSGEIRGGGAVKRFLVGQLDELKDYVKKCGRAIVETKAEGSTLPRYLRVNVNRFKSVDAAVAKLKADGINGIEKDEHIPHLLVADAKETKNLVNLDIVKKGDILLQDKSTCVTAYALLGNRPKGPSSPIHVIDACAAPGGKTLHILENLRPGDSLTAIELDPKRAQILEERLTALGDTKRGVKVQVLNCDYLKLLQDDARLGTPVTHINLDPSCSGSGMAGPSTKGKDKLKTLASFQSMMLRHALNEFEKVEVVCYSTCSVLSVENEDVVNANLDHGFKVDMQPLPGWWKTTCDDGFIRTTPEKDKCRGFFLAKLVRSVS
jgi:16S rRNA (cytosine967-C5)-methyltransferase